MPGNGVASRDSLLAAILVGALTIAYCVPAPFVTLWPDTVRDLADSLTLARGEGVPLVGPPINFGPRAGPAWVWLQAIALLFDQSFVATSLFVAAVASLKFALLYALGARFSGPRLGICFAAAAAFPTFNVYQWIVFFHPNWVEAAICSGLLLLLMADRRKSVPVVYAGGAMLALAVQMHATSVFYVPLAGVVLHRIGLRGGKLAMHCVGMSLLVAAGFAPELLAPAAERGVLASATRRIANDLGNFHPAAVGTALQTAYLGFPVAIGETYGGRGHVPSWLWTAGLVFVAVTVASGAWSAAIDPGRRPLLGTVVAAWAAGWCIAVAVRNFTSFYLVYFLLPLSAILMGLTLDAAAASRLRWMRRMAWASIVMLALSLVATAYGARAVGRSALIDSRILAMGDLAHPAAPPVRGVLMTVAARDALDGELCRATSAGTVNLHGELAYAASMGIGLDFRMHCPASADRVRVFGAGPGTHFAALPEDVATSLAIRQGRTIRGVRLMTQVRPLFPREPRPIESKWYHFEQHDPRPEQDVVLDFDTMPGEVVVVHRHKPFASTWSSLIQSDGAQPQPDFTTFDSSLFRSSRPGHWHVRIRTDAPEWTEIVVLSP